MILKSLGGALLFIGIFGLIGFYTEKNAEVFKKQLVERITGWVVLAMSFAVLGFAIAADFTPDQPVEPAAVLVEPVPEQPSEAELRRQAVLAKYTNLTVDASEFEEGSAKHVAAQLLQKLKENDIEGIYPLAAPSWRKTEANTPESLAENFSFATVLGVEMGDLTLYRGTTIQNTPRVITDTTKSAYAQLKFCVYSDWSGAIMKYDCIMRLRREDGNAALSLVGKWGVDPDSCNVVSRTDIDNYDN